VEEVAEPLARTDSLRTTGALLALSLATFTLVTTESLPVGLLGPIAADLHRSRSAVGFLVTGYAFTVVAVSLPLAYATKRVPRRHLLVGALAVFVVGSALGAAATSYDVLLATRMAIALAHAVFWACVAATAAALVPPARRGRALGLVFAGSSLASVLGLPAITWIGQHTSWRVATLTAAGLGLAALAAVGVLLPTAPPEEGHAALGAHASPRRFAVVLVTLALAITGAFAALTYVTAFLTSASGFSAHAISPILLAQGLAGVAGVVVAGRLVVRRPRATMGAAVAGLAVSLLALAACAHVRPAVIVLLGLFGFSLSGLAISVQSRVLDTAPGNPEIASAGNSAVFNVGIGGGALLGGLLLPGLGVRSIDVAGGLLAAAALAVVLAEGPFVSRGSRAHRDRA
jgi:MFS transporter, DHA1 family, inner membrane transport protein